MTKENMSAVLRAMESKRAATGIQNQNLMMEACLSKTVISTGVENK